MKKKNGISIAMFVALMFVFLNFISMPVMAAPGDVEINYTNFPNMYFKEYVKKNFDLNKDDILSQDELDAVKIIDVNSKKNINDLKGVEHFNKLEELDCGDIGLTYLDVTKNPELKTLICSRNQLDSLDVSNNKKLKKLECNACQLGALDVSKNTELEILNAYANYLPALDLTKNLKLKDLDCGFNLTLKTLDVSNNTKLEYLACYTNPQMTILDVTNNTQLKALFCSYNNLSNLDVTKNPELKTLDCSQNQLTSLDFSNNTKLEELKCNENKLSNLDFTKNPELKILDCYRNQLTSLDFSNNKKLESLDCGACQLETLDVSKNQKLKKLWCYTNQLTSLDISANTDINSFNGSNQKYSIEVGNKTRTFDLSSFPGNFDPLKASEWTGGNIEVNTLTLDNTMPSEVTYKYKTSDNFLMPVTLNVSFKDEVIIKFDKNGGSGTMDDRIALKGLKYTLPDCTFTPPAGKEFEAWVIGTEEKNVGDSITINADTTVKAIWKEKPVTPSAKITITFDKNGGTGTMAKGSIDKGSSYTLPACGFTPPAGKEFKAWQVDGTEKNVGDSIIVNGNTTVKAVWKDTGSNPPFPPTPPTPHKPYNPYPWTYPGYWHNDLETPKSKENKQVNSLINEWKIQLTIGIDLLYKEINGVGSNIQMDIAPYINDGRTMLPVRFVAEALGFDVDWDKSTRTVILKQDKTRVEIPVETNQIIVNGDVYTSDVKPEIKNNRTMLPIANIARALGLQDGKDIIWNSHTKTATIKMTK